MKIPVDYTALEAFHIRGHNSHHSAIVLQPKEVNKKPIVLISNENTQGKSISNAIENIAGAVMDKQGWPKNSAAIWLEVSEANPNIIQPVESPTFIPSWGCEDTFDNFMKTLSSEEATLDLSM